jgi:hypothetical protein
MPAADVRKLLYASYVAPPETTWQTAQRKDVA